MMYADTKKDVHTSVEIHYNECRHELTPRGEGASEGCRPKLPRWPFSISDCTQLRAPPWMEVWYGIRVESQAFFCNALHFFDHQSYKSHAERLVVAFVVPDNL